jgi:predicted aldo/keto reductase-like oxidoreductase
MRYNILGRTGIRASALGMGTNRLTTVDKAQGMRVLNHALNVGINYINTGYGSLQDTVGRGIGHRRDEFAISSKCNGWRGDRTADAVRRGIDESLRLLRMDVIDIYELPNCPDLPHLEISFEPGGYMDALLEAKEQGKIRFIGITAHRPDVIAAALPRGVFDTAVFMVNAVEPYGIRELLPLAHELGVGTVGIRAISHGALAPVEKALTWSLHSGVDVSLSGMLTEREVDENVAIAGREFPPEEIAQLQAEMASLPESGCRNCAMCACPYDLSIGWLLPMLHYRDRYNLLPGAEATWQTFAAKARDIQHICDGCRQCEPMCPYDVPIVELMHQVAERAEPKAST